MKLLAALGENRGGVLVVVLIVFATAFTVQWFAWIFGLGRFRRDPLDPKAPAKPSTIRYLVTELFVRVITEFRHFLALVLFSVFAIALICAIYPGVRTLDVDAISKGLQAVAAALGGLLGSVIGYYFGESAGSKDPNAPKPAPDAQPAVQRTPDDDATSAPASPVVGMKSVPPPPGVLDALDADKPKDPT